MDLTQETLFSLLLKENGKIKNSDLLDKFQNLLNCSDRDERTQNRELFKKFINNIAVVKEFDDGKYVVLRKRYHHLLFPMGNSGETEHGELEHESTPEDTDTLVKVQERSLNVPSGEISCPDISAESIDSIRRDVSPGITEERSPIHLALERSTAIDIKPKRSLNFVQNQVLSLNESCEDPNIFIFQMPPNNTQKPCALPLRLPVTEQIISSPNGATDCILTTPRNKSRPPSFSGDVINSTFIRPGYKNCRASELVARHPVLVPLEQNEHEWLVKSAAGQWDQVYGLLLLDAHLAEKRDFMSGFTALHWAVKSGNSQMVVKIIEVSRKVGGGIDINTKTHGGYTPLHIAAIHDQEFIMTMLVREYKADVRIRDNCGKRAYHYLHKGISDTVRELLGEPKASCPGVGIGEELAPEREESDLHRGHSTLHWLLQPNALNPRKLKLKHREFFSSVSDLSSAFL